LSYALFSSLETIFFGSVLIISFIIYAQNGEFAVHLAADSGLTEIVALLLALNRADANLPGWNSRTPLHYAAAKGHFEIVDMLVKEYGVDIFLTDDTRCTPLHLACKEGHINIVRHLVRNCGANLEARDEVTFQSVKTFFFVLTVTFYFPAWCYAFALCCRWWSPKSHNCID
jgi:ankyrin repeat protein